MSVILNLETATTNCSVSVSQRGEILALVEENRKEYSHAELLHVFIEQAIQNAGCTMEDISAVAVSKGPGSYTGLRIGVAAAKGLCYALNVPLIAVSTLESMARQFEVDRGFLIPVLDARRMEVYSSVYNAGYEQVRETLAEVIDENSFAEYTAQDTVYLIGAGAEKCEQMLSHQNFRFYPKKVPSAKEMALISHDLFQKGQLEDLAYFEPYYLKEFILQKKSAK